MLDKVLDFARRERASALDGLTRFLRIPSISAEPEHAPDVLAACEFAADEFRQAGMQNVRVVLDPQGTDHPLILAEWRNAPGKPTIGIYTHVDVQPVGDGAGWTTPPFQPDVRDGLIYARGSSDNKGHTIIVSRALRALIAVTGGLPCNVVLIIESSEESDGEHIRRFTEQHGKSLGLDAMVVLDLGMFAPGMPTITTGLRGLICSTLNVHTGFERHSGQFGNLGPNAAEELAVLTAQLRDPRTRQCLIPGFYDDVRQPDPQEVASWRALPFDLNAYLVNEIGAPMLVGGQTDPVSIFTNLFARPTLEINGLCGGTTTGAFKTSQPGDAVAKISFRLVPDQDPAAIAAAYEKFIAGIAPPWAVVKVNDVSLTRAMVVDTNNHYVAKAADALSATFNGAKTAFVREGSSIPIAVTFQEVLAVPLVLTGFTMPDCHEHAPNESMVVENFHLGTEALIRYLWLLGQP